MSQTTTMIVRISGALSEFVASNVGENGSYENVSEYVSDLVRRDKERVEQEAFDRLKAELTRAFATPDESYRPLSATEVIGRHRDDPARTDAPDGPVSGGSAEVTDATGDDYPHPRWGARKTLTRC